MAFQPIEIKSSSHVSAVSYDEDDMVLKVSFHGGRTYTYSKVPGLVAAGFAQADSPGQYLHQNVKGQYEYDMAGKASE